MLGLISGCSNISQKWYGKWEGNLQRTDPAMPDDDVKRTIDYLSVTILRNGTFEMVESGIPVTGSHNLGSEKAFLTIKTRAGQPVSEKESTDLTLTWNGDGSILWHDPAGFDGHPVRLTLKPQPSK